MHHHARRPTRGQNGLEFAPAAAEIHSETGRTSSRITSVIRTHAGLDAAEGVAATTASGTAGASAREVSSTKKTPSPRSAWHRETWWHLFSADRCEVIRAEIHEHEAPGLDRFGGETPHHAVRRLARHRTLVEDAGCEGAGPGGIDHQPCLALQAGAAVSRWCRRGRIPPAQPSVQMRSSPPAPSGQWRCRGGPGRTGRSRCRGPPARS